jgi:hypothetical protein
MSKRKEFVIAAIVSAAVSISFYFSALLAFATVGLAVVTGFVYVAVIMPPAGAEPKLPAKVKVPDCLPEGFE